MAIVLGEHIEKAAAWLDQTGWAKLERLLVVVFTCVVILWALRLVSRAVGRSMETAMGEGNPETQRRAKTLAAVIGNFARVLVVSFFLLETLQEFNVNVGPLVAGVGILGAAIEQNFDERGMIFSNAMAPFTVVIVPMGYGRSETVRAAADQLYADLQAQGIDVLLDDRDERPGVLLADSELLGIPHRVVGGLGRCDQVMADTFWLGVHPGLTGAHLAFMAETLREAL